MEIAVRSDGSFLSLAYHRSIVDAIRFKSLERCSSVRRSRCLPRPPRFKKPNNSATSTARVAAAPNARCLFIAPLRRSFEPQKVVTEYAACNDQHSEHLQAEWRGQLTAQEAGEKYD